MTWLVVLIWVSALAFAVLYLGRIALRLGKKATSAMAAGEPIALKLAELNAAAAVKPRYEAKPDNLLDDPAPHILELQRLQKQKAKRADEQQRRLIARLKNLGTKEN